MATALSGADVALVREGVFNLPCDAVNGAGNSAIAAGDRLYFTEADDPNNLSKKNAGKFAGYALGALGTGTTGLVDVLLLGDEGPGEGDIENNSILHTKMAGSLLVSVTIAGGAAGDHNTAGLAVGDRLVSVNYFALAADTGTAATGNKLVSVADIKAECTIAAGKINNAAGTDTTNGFLIVLWEDLT